ncbi:MAG: GDP-mannose 4,6-dehydratase, partial [candidate division NC10 bacterium]|nr:GDP-mannose 4,6-dehydratase [candidate division NC10 bacterium]
MRALVTGVAGFAGSHLADLLISQGVDVYGLVMPGASLENLHEIRGDPLRADRLRLVEADIVDEQSLSGIVKDICPDQVYHLAAASSVRRSLDAPGETFRVNVLGSRHLLEAIRRAAIR